MKKGVYEICMVRMMILLGLGLLWQACTHSEPLKKENVFRYNESKGIPSLDPAFAKSQYTIWPVNQIFNGLVQLDHRLIVQPCIAKSWEISSSGKEYTFLLRDDVFFHDHPVFPSQKGRRVVAHDFVYSFMRIVDPEVASPGAWIFNQLDFNRPGGAFQAMNDTVLKIFLKESFPAFIGLLSMQYCSVVPEEVVKHYKKDFRSHPIGTGPFYFKKWIEGERLVFLKNPNYFEKDSTGNSLPYLDGVSIRFIADKQSEFLEFIKGNIDFLSGLHASYKDELLTRSGKLQKKYEGKVQVFNQAYLNTEYLGFLLDEDLEMVKNSPLCIKKVRQAINYGFDRRKMITYLRNNMGTPANWGVVPDGLPSFSKESVKGFSYQPSKSRELLKSAGYPGGKGLPEITLSTSPDYLDICEYIQHQLSEIGIRISIEVNTGASFRSMVANSKLGFFRASWIADYPDAENYLALFYSGNFSPKGPNYTHFKNERYDALYEASLLCNDTKKRFDLYHQMDQIIIDEAVIVPLFYDKVVRFVGSDIEGMESNPLNLMVLKTVRKKTD